MDKQERKCRRCLRKEGRRWGTTPSCDLDEGICPKVVENEVYTCELTGEKLPMLGRVKIIGCGV